MTSLFDELHDRIKNQAKNSNIETQIMQGKLTLQREKQKCPKQEVNFQESVLGLQSSIFYDLGFSEKLIR